VSVSAMSRLVTTLKAGVKQATAAMTTRIAATG
jgi:hypothetical protein